MIGLGLGTTGLASWFRASTKQMLAFGGGNTYAGALEFQAVGVAMITALIGFNAFIRYLNYPTAFNALRAWKQNFFVFWVVLATTSLPI